MIIKEFNKDFYCQIKESNCVGKIKIFLGGLAKREREGFTQRERERERAQ